MEMNSREERRRIFRLELFMLKNEGYLAESIVETVAKAHHQYHLDLIEKEEKTLELVRKQLSQKAEPKKPQKVKKTLTQEEVRERNITWLLNIGVIFLLIGGLFVATSNWESMTSVMKSGVTAIVSIIFYGIALLTKKVLHIEKTAFAFIVLGSLFVPIFILSLGWFGLLGPYLSINGDGRFLLGMLGSFLPVIIYLLFAKYLNSRLFVWFTYISFSVGVAFLLAALHLKIDFFYLGMMFFNAALIFAYHRLKQNETLQLFLHEFIPFVQVNLVLSTLFMLFLFDNEVLYSINLILSAIIYLSMMYVSGRKEYHFIFSAMIVYGAYQLIEHSFLDYFSDIIYALIGFGMVLVPKILNERFSLNKVFHYTSAVISGFAFIYISLRGLLLHSGNPSIVLMIAYLIIACNFIYLSHNSRMPLFPYLSSVFCSSGIYEAIALTVKPINGINFSLILFLSGFILYIPFAIVPIRKYLEIIRQSSKDVGLAFMLFAILSAITMFEWWELGVMLLLLTIVAYLLVLKEKRLLYQKAAKWALPSSFGLALASFGEELNSNFISYYEVYGYGVNFAVGAIVVLMLSFAWKKTRNKELTRTSLYVSQCLYTIAILHSLTSPINVLWVRPLVLLLGLGMYLYLYKVIGTKWVPYLIAITTWLSYFSIIAAVNMKISFSLLLNSFIISTSIVILLIFAAIYRAKDCDLSNAFGWMGHCLYPVALLFTMIGYQTDAVYSFVVAFFVYAYSTKVVSTEWKKMIFLFGGFTSLFFSISLGLDHFIDQNFASYEFPITSVLILFYFVIADKENKKRTAYYFVPFSIIGLVFMIFMYPYNLLPFLVTCGYAIMILFYLHKRKGSLIAIIPLFLTFFATFRFFHYSGMAEDEKILLSGGLGLIIVIIGQSVNKKLFEYGTKIQEMKLDSYTIISFLFFFMMYFFENQPLWTHVLPGLLIAINLWLQRKRVPASVSDFMSIFGGVYLLQPYYSVIKVLNIPPLWEREVHVLPFIILVIFIRYCLKGRFSDITKAIEWGTLLIVSLLLIQDGLASNTIYDAIILGSLSLLSLLTGMFLQIKSYFFVGSGVLLLNVILQTRPYWGNKPWWVYLLIAGLILITVASFNEWNKQKVQKGETTFITLLKEKVIAKMKKWN